MLYYAAGKRLMDECNIMFQAIQHLQVTAAVNHEIRAIMSSVISQQCEVQHYKYEQQEQQQKQQAPPAEQEREQPQQR
jgi:hypothetical protein